MIGEGLDDIKAKLSKDLFGLTCKAVGCVSLEQILKDLCTGNQNLRLGMNLIEICDFLDQIFVLLFCFHLGLSLSLSHHTSFHLHRHHR